MLLDALASRYGTDPAQVLTWTPFRLGLAMETLGAAQAFHARMRARVEGGVQPVHVLGVL